VLNLAAGLDTRPYRLNLPLDFTSVEADLPELLAEEAQLLADEQLRCRLTRSAVDLADPRARDAFLTDALAGATKALVLTEGLLMYLDDRDVSALSRAIMRPEVVWWMLDFARPGLKKMMNKKMAACWRMRRSSSRPTTGWPTSKISAGAAWMPSRSSWPPADSTGYRSSCAPSPGCCPSQTHADRAGRRGAQLPSWFIEPIAILATSVQPTRTAETSRWPALRETG
jgi:O-methyltransferase involved in polyketide biosynthesis